MSPSPPLARRTDDITGPLAIVEGQLTLAAAAGDARRCRDLLPRLAQALRPTPGSATGEPIVEAARWDYTEVLQLLLEAYAEAGALTGRLRARALYHACEAGHAPTVRLLLASRRGSRDGEAACRARGAAGVEIPLRFGPLTGADLLPLHAAAQWGHAACVEALLSANADVQTTDRLGRTALHRAAAWGCIRTVRALLGYSACPTLPDAAGATPRELALKYKHDELALLLGAPNSLLSSHRTWGGIDRGGGGAALQDEGMENTGGVAPDGDKCAEAVRQRGALPPFVQEPPEGPPCVLRPPRGSLSGSETTVRPPSVSESQAGPPSVSEAQAAPPLVFGTPAGPPSVSETQSSQQPATAISHSPIITDPIPIAGAFQAPDLDFAPTPPAVPGPPPPELSQPCSPRLRLLLRAPSPCRPPMLASPSNRPASPPVAKPPGRRAAALMAMWHRSRGVGGTWLGGRRAMVRVAPDD